MEKIPTSRDPWGILSQTPGVVTDRINVGGNESGQQSNFVGTGANSRDNAFAVDGVVISDMSALGASPTYYDFDAFEEVNISTGGTDISLATGGVTVNLVTKRGTNDWRGSGRFFLTDGSNQSDPDVSGGEAGVNFNGDGGASQSQDLRGFSANEIDEVEDMGLEVGGFLVKDRLWIWGAYGENDINNVVAGGAFDRTLLENYNGKLNAQVAPSNSAVGSFSRGDKIKNGRNAGPTRPPATTWNQAGPTEIWKVEDTHIFNPSFYLSGLYSFVDGGFALLANGGQDTQIAIDENGIYRNTFLDFGSDRDVDQWRLEASVFFDAGNTSHELKFGGGFREAETASFTTWGQGPVIYHCSQFGCDEDDFAANPALTGTNVWRPLSLSVTSEYTSAWAQDTLTVGHLTVNAGVRYDDQEGNNGQGQVDALTFAGQQFFPAVDFSGDSSAFGWETVSPRVGVTYSLGEAGKTLIRGSFSRFSEQLGTNRVTRINPASYAYASAYFNDTNGNLLLDESEISSIDIFSYYGFDPSNPVASSPNQIDPGFDPSLIDELRVGVEHAFRPEFVAGVAVTYRDISDLPERRLLITDESGAPREATAADYVQAGTVDGTLPNGASYSEPFFDLRSGLAWTGGTRLVTGDRGQEYLGATVHATKRLSNRWMLRANFTLSDWEYDIGDEFKAFDNPTNVLEVSPELDLGDDDGGVVAEQSEGSGGKTGIWQNSEWSFTINGMVQLPLGFNVAANLNGREGFPNPLFHNASTSVGTLSVQVTPDLDTFRHDDIYTLDVRVEKEFTIGDFDATVSLDGFNLVNENTVLQRQRSATSGSFDFITETLSPRVFRLGLRLGFK